MRRFGIVVLCVLAVMGVRAERPMAECRDGKCVVKEEDWNRFKEFWRRIERFAKEMDAKAMDDAKAQFALAQKLQSCMAILEERKS